MSVCTNCYRSSCGSFRHVPNLSYIKFAKNALAKAKLTNIASVMFVSTKSEYSRVLTHVTNSLNGCFRRKAMNAHLLS